MSWAHFRHTDWSTFGPMNTMQLQFLMLILAGWVKRSQQDVIEYLQEESSRRGEILRDLSDQSQTDSLLRIGVP